MDPHKRKPVAIDPIGCGCTECMVGEYVPLEDATWKDYRRVKKGKARNNTGLPKKRIRDFLERGEFYRMFWDEHFGATREQLWP